MPRTVVGLDIGRTAVRAVELRRGRRPVVRRHGRVPLPVGAVEAGLVVDAAAVTAALRQLWREQKIASRQVRLGVGSGSVLGNSCEFKNCFIHNEGEVPHFAYVGDSMLGFKAHLGAGVKISNVKLTWETVKIKGEHGVIDTGMLKLGAILGDNTDIGCNSVLNPGSLIGKKSIIYPGSSWRGVLPAGRIVKKRETFEVVERRQS